MAQSLKIRMRVAGHGLSVSVYQILNLSPSYLLEFYPSSILLFLFYLRKILTREHGGDAVEIGHTFGGQGTVGIC